MSNMGHSQHKYDVISNELIHINECIHNKYTYQVSPGMYRKLVILNQSVESTNKNALVVGEQEFKIYKMSCPSN